MKASNYKKYGSPSVIQVKEVDKPTPKDNEVLIRVHATTVNRTDCAMLRAKPFIMRFITGLFKPTNPILGTDFAGEIASLGKSVKSYKVGDRVFGFEDIGANSHAQYMVRTEESPMAIIPAAISYKQAAASIEGVHYALNMLNKVPLQSGQKVLVNGATGAIGSAAVQLLVHFGLEVTAVCNTQSIVLIKSLGASSIFDYQKEDFTQVEGKYSFIFDTVGKSTFAKCKPLLEAKGAYISSEIGHNGENLFFALSTPISSKFPGQEGKRVVFPYPIDIQGSLDLIKTLIEEEKFKAVIDREYDIDKIVEAFKYVETGEKIGNVVITY